MYALSQSDYRTLTGLVNAAISNYEVRRLRVLVDPSHGWDVGQLRAFYASEIETLNQTLAKLQALNGATINPILPARRQAPKANHPPFHPAKVNDVKHSVEPGDGIHQYAVVP
jgi:hypothetical protein